MRVGRQQETSTLHHTAAVSADGLAIAHEWQLTDQAPVREMAGERSATLKLRVPPARQLDFS